MKYVYIDELSDRSEISDDTKFLIYRNYFDHRDIIVPDNIYQLKVTTNGLINLPESLKLLYYSSTIPIERFPDGLVGLNISNISDNTVFPNSLKSLILRDITVSKLVLPNNLDKLKLSNCNINCDIILPESLKMLSLFRITKIPNVSHLKNLKTLVLFDTSINYIPNLPIKYIYLTITGSDNSIPSFFGYNMGIRSLAVKFYGVAYNYLKIINCIMKLQRKFKNKHFI